MTENKVSTIDDLQTSQERQIAPNRHFGNTLPIYWREDGEPKYVLGPHYPMFMITLLLSAIVFIVLAYNIVASAKGRQTEMGVALTLSILFYVYSYIKVGFSNPGLASSWNQAPDEIKTNLRYCVPCRILRPSRTLHCYSCDICIYEYDHHCVWVGKCIGRDNLSQFKCFLLSVVQLFCTLGICIYTASLYDVQNTSVNQTLR